MSLPKNKYPERVQKAFATMPRHLFLPPDYQGASDVDAPIPIGFGQTNSQPTTVRFMLEWLSARPGDKVLDIGSGSGWTTALLSYIIGNKGKVHAVEVVPELVNLGEQNCRKLNLKNVYFHQASKDLGLPDKRPFDRILVSAAAKQLPKRLSKQLKPGGKLVIPVKNDILEITKDANDKLEIIAHPGFVFVPLI